MTKVLRKHQGIVPGFLDCGPRELLDLLGGPTLMRVDGPEGGQALLVSLLLHGNETSGLAIVQGLLKNLAESGRPPRKTLLVFVGNVAGAACGLRVLPGEPDMNRIWAPPRLPGGLAHAVMDEIKCEGSRLFAVVDLHNNSGRNPHYGCIARLDAAHLQLAALFHHLAVFVEQPDSTFAYRCSEFAPAITLECGQPGDPVGIREAQSFLEACLKTAALPQRLPAAEDLTLYETVARLKVAPNVSFGFEGEEFATPPALLLRADLDALNFVEQESGARLARVDLRPGVEPLIVEPKVPNSTTSGYVKVEDGHLVLGERLTPAMLTKDRRIVVDDCLGYLMRPLDWAHSPHVPGSLPVVL